MSPTPPVTQEEIFRAFSTAFERRAALKLHNVFRGVPVSYPAMVSAVGPDTVTLKVHSLQSVVISLEKRTFIETEYLPIILRGYPKGINHNQQTVILTHFSPAGKAFIERNHLRVQPEQPVKVDIFGGEGVINGTMSDISISGAGIFVFGAYISAQISLNLSGDTEVGLYLSLPGVDQMVHLVGTISSVTREKAMKMTRIGIKITPDKRSEETLRKYINQRQADILEELQRIYQRTLAAKKDE